MEYIIAPRKTTPNASLVLGATTPFGGSGLSGGRRGFRGVMKVLLCRRCCCALGLNFGTLRRQGLKEVNEDIMRALRERGWRQLSYNKHETTIQYTPSERVQPVRYS